MFGRLKERERRHALRQVPGPTHNVKIAYGFELSPLSARSICRERATYQQFAFMPPKSIFMNQPTSLR